MMKEIDLTKAVPTAPEPVVEEPIHVPTLPPWEVEAWKERYLVVRMVDGTRKVDSVGQFGINALIYESKKAAQDRADELNEKEQSNA